MNRSVVETTKRILFFFVFAICVWICVSLTGVKNEYETVSANVGFVGSVATLGACFSLALQKQLRENGGALAPYFCSLVGRTVVPLIATLGVVLCCDENVRREIAVRVLIGYFGTAPLHVWATIPGE